MANEKQVKGDLLNIPMKYHDALAERLDGVASDCGCEMTTLRNVTETAIRTRHQEATFKRPSHKANGRQPDIYSLNLGLPRSLSVYYTIENEGVVIRGYGWEIAGPPMDFWDGGGFWCEDDWEERIDSSDDWPTEFC